MIEVKTITNPTDEKINKVISELYNNYNGLKIIKIDSIPWIKDLTARRNAETIIEKVRIIYEF